MDDVPRRVALPVLWTTQMDERAKRNFEDVQHDEGHSADLLSDERERRGEGENERQNPLRNGARVKDVAVPGVASRRALCPAAQRRAGPEPTPRRRAGFLGRR